MIGAVFVAVASGAKGRMGCLINVVLMEMIGDQSRRWRMLI